MRSGVIRWWSLLLGATRVISTTKDVNTISVTYLRINGRNVWVSSNLQKYWDGENSMLEYRCTSVQGSRPNFEQMKSKQMDLDLKREHLWPMSCC
jgi:hypothetical protein